MAKRKGPGILHPKIFLAAGSAKTSGGEEQEAFSVGSLSYHKNL